MATEMLEYRPGKWVKVVDGRIVGRATDEEVAAWRTLAGATPSASACMALDIDLELPAHVPQAQPGRVTELPQRPAFERRGRPVEAPAGSGQNRPGAAAGRPKDGLSEMTVETAIAREARIRQRQAPGAPAAESSGVVLIRRRAAPRVDAPAAPQGGPVTEVTPVPKLKPEASLTPAAPPEPARSEKPKPAPVRRAPRAARKEAAQAAAPAAEPEVPGAELPDADASPEAEPEATARASGQGPSFWWICNANHQPVEAFLKDWAPKYEAKFGHRVSFVLCHADDLAAVQASGFDADMSPLLQPGHFFLGHNGEESEATTKKKAR